MKTHKGKSKSRHLASSNSKLSVKAIDDTIEIGNPKAKQSRRVVDLSNKLEKNDETVSNAVDAYLGDVENMKDTPMSPKILTEDNGFIKSNSTPRRKKYVGSTNLSPKYIGLKTLNSTDPSTPSTAGRIRQMRRKNHRECSQSQSVIKGVTSAFLAVSSPDNTSYIRRTNSSSLKNSPLSGSDSEASHLKRSFESPIEKLLRKNKTFNLQTPPDSEKYVQFSPKAKQTMERKELMDIKVNVARDGSLEMLHRNGINTFQLDQHDNITTMTLENCEVSEDNESKKHPEINKGKISHNDCDLSKNYEKLNDDSILSVEISNGSEKTTPVKTATTSNHRTSLGFDLSQAPENKNIKRNLHKLNSDVVESLEEKNNRNKSVQVSSEQKSGRNEKIENVERSQGSEGNAAIFCSTQEKESGKISTKANIFDDQTGDENYTHISSAEFNEPNVDSSKGNQELLAGISLVYEGENKNTPDDVVPIILLDESENGKIEDKDNLNYNDAASFSNNCHEIYIDNKSATTATLSTANSKPRHVPNTETFLHVENIVSVKSPSSLSTDSAKGSSVTNEVAWISFSCGDLFWGQIYSYCYWPCIVCPDPDGKTITTEVGAGRSGAAQVMVHVRFFADNARRNWVKRGNLLVYNDLESFHQKMFEIEEKYGKKNPKYKAFIVPKSKKKLWTQAIEEANTVKSTAIAERLEKFYQIYENSRLLSKLERKRRQSMYIQLDSTSDIGSLYDSSDNLSVKQLSVGAKRDRSSSPFSPAYSPIGPKSAKRRKLSEDEETASAALNRNTTFHSNAQEEDLQIIGSSLSPFSMISTASQHDEQIFENSEFPVFFKAMKEFVMEQNNDEKLERSLIVAARNIWALKHISNCQMQARATEGVNQNDLGSTIVGSTYGSSGIKRLSNRLRIISLKRSLAKHTIVQMNSSLPISNAYSLTPEIPNEEKMKRSVINRPIEEVIDDIFNLDSKYLFKGLSRDPICKYCLRPSGGLEKCSKNCQTWFHVNCVGNSEKAKSKKHVRKSKSIANSVSEGLILDANSSVHITADENELRARASKSPEQNAQNHKPQDQAEGKDSQEKNLNEAISTTESECAAVCRECKIEEQPKCAVCKQNRGETEELIQCNIPHCLNAFHPACCRYWPQSKITKSKNKIQSFRCPTHVCHTCVSDDPKGKFQNISSSKLTRCALCPATFHTDSTCIPAGSQILTAAYLICPRHNISKTDQKVNVNWCFICVRGGQVVCCETCPTAIHASCLNIPIDSEENYICEECETGRMPLYGEMVWAKFNNFRWWPAIILPPTEIPQNIMRMPHSPSNFVVRFFGTHDHGWISRRRVYLYLEGDSTEPPKNRKSLDANYTRGVEEAKRIWEIMKSKKNVHRLSNESKQKLHPQPYVKIKSNRAVPPLKLHVDLDKVSKCDCDQGSENPCGPDSNCLNRVLYHECNPKLCPAGERCQNQMFESRVSPKLEVVYMKERGFGLVCREPISAGTFVIEYVGEVINHDEFKQRMTQKTADREENFYFLSLEKDYIIDAGPKGNLARFMNHSCDPNCETQKWSVNGLNRVGLFAIRDIATDTELTFNYHWDELLGTERKTCFCGSVKCAGQIGGKFKETKMKDDAKPIKNKASKKTNVKSLKRLQKKRHKKGEEKHAVKTRPKAGFKETETTEDDKVNDSIRISADLSSIEPDNKLDV